MKFFSGWQIKWNKFFKRQNSFRFQIEIYVTSVDIKDLPTLSWDQKCKGIGWKKFVYFTFPLFQWRYRHPPVLQSSTNIVWLGMGYESPKCSCLTGLSSLSFSTISRQIKVSWRRLKTNLTANRVYRSIKYVKSSLEDPISNSWIICVRWELLLLTFSTKCPMSPRVLRI